MKRDINKLDDFQKLEEVFETVEQKYHQEKVMNLNALYLLWQMGLLSLAGKEFLLYLNNNKNGDENIIADLKKWGCNQTKCKGEIKNANGHKV